MKTIIAFLILTTTSLSLASDLETKIVAVAARHGLNAAEFRAVLVVESRLKLNAINHRTKDYGIGQINYKTAKAHGWDLQRLTTDLDYSLTASATILAGMKRYDSYNYLCRYNVGHRKLTGNILTLCNLYRKKVQAALKSHQKPPISYAWWQIPARQVASEGQ